MPKLTGGLFWFLSDNTPEIVALLHKQVGEAVKKAALDIQAKAMKGAPVDTGFLKSSIYTVTKDGSSYGSIEAGSGDLLPEVDKPANDHTAFTAVGASYGAYVEYGTQHMGAQPYLQPAVDAVAPAFLEAMRRLEEKFPAYLTHASVEE